MALFFVGRCLETTLVRPRYVVHKVSKLDVLAVSLTERLWYMLMFVAKLSKRVASRSNVDS